jgi:3-hydroxyisobutyrate dehydrogenase
MENTMTSNYTVTVLGLGAMGLPMATRLASQLTVHGFDIAEPRLELAKEAGIATFATAREAAKGADAVLLAVRNGEQLNDVLFGENGVASVLEPGAVVILGSTGRKAGRIRRRTRRRPVVRRPQARRRRRPADRRRRVP